MSLTNCTGSASQTDDPKPCITRAAIKLPYVVHCEDPIMPAQNYGSVNFDSSS